MNRIILDTDVGTDVDDAFAIALAINSPEIKVEGITTVYGNASLRAKIAKKLVGMGGRDDVKVYAGIGDPLLKNREVWFPEHVGKGVVEDGEDVPFESGHAVNFIIETIMNNPGEITLVPIACLTNIAAAMILEPRICGNLKEIVMMGGVARVGEKGLTLPVIEKNIECDPEAAAVVFGSGVPITMVGLDVTTQVEITRKEIEILARSNKPLNLTIKRMFDFWTNYIGQDGWTHMHDPLAVSLMVDRTLVRTKKVNVQVQYDHRHPSGVTILTEDPQGKVEAALEVDAGRFLDLLIKRLA